VAPLPMWYEDSPDWTTDKSAHDDVVNRKEQDARRLHRAVRHHNWRQDIAAVQEWTRHAHGVSRKLCWSEAWTGLSPVSPRGPLQLVTHRLLVQLNDADLERQVLANLNDPHQLLLLARRWHQGLSTARPQGAIWLGDKVEVESRVPFEPDRLHDTLSVLGLWHFGLLPAAHAGAVFRLVYEVDNDVPLYKPDWRHGYANFYWASVPKIDSHGLARDLATGTLQCKEWVAKIDQLDARKHLKSAQCLVPNTAHCHYDLPEPFWSTLAHEIQGAPGVVK
jgi:hypothetical protein